MKKDRDFLCKLYFLHFIFFVKLVFEEKKIFFQNEENFWSIYLIAYNLIENFVDNRYFNLCKNEISNRKLIINMPPRHYKSMICSVIFPAWLWAVDPKIQIIIASYNQKLSQKHLYDCKMVIQSSVYQRYFKGVMLHKKYNRKNDAKNEDGGHIFATSIYSGAMGIGADFIIVDDPHNPNDMYSQKKLQNAINNLQNNIFSRLNNQMHGSIILVMQRLHVNDLSGHLLKNKDWNCMSLQLKNDKERRVVIFGQEKIFRKGEILNGEIFDEKAIENLRDEIGDINFNAQYQQNPQNFDFGVVNEGLLNFYDSENGDGFVEEDGLIVHSWDTANSAERNNYTVGTIWQIKDEKYYLLDLCRVQVDYPELKKLVVGQYDKYGGVVLIEDKANGSALIQELSKTINMTLLKCRPRTNKYSRLMQILYFFEKRLVFLPKKAPWLDELKNELFNFPNSKYDDQVDSISQFFNWVRENHAKKSQVCVMAV